MKWYAHINVFRTCEFRELKDLYDEFQKYDLLAQIKPSSPLYKYKDLFWKASVDHSFERFYMMFLKTYCDALRKYEEEKHILDDVYNMTNPRKDCPLFCQDGKCKILKTHCYDVSNDICDTVRLSYNAGFVACHSIISKNKNEQEKNDDVIN